MIVTCERVDKRLDAVWRELQAFYSRRYTMSQIQVDETCVNFLELVIERHVNECETMDKVEKEKR